MVGHMLRDDFFFFVFQFNFSREEIFMRWYNNKNFEQVDLHNKNTELRIFWKYYIVGRAFRMTLCIFSVYRTDI